MVHRLDTRALVCGILVLVLPGTTCPRAQDAAEAPRTGGLIGAFWDYPTKASVGFGVIATRMPANFECQTACLFRGLTIQGTAGLGGGGGFSRVREPHR